MLKTKQLNPILVILFLFPLFSAIVPKALEEIDNTIQRQRDKKFMESSFNNRVNEIRVLGSDLRFSIEGTSNWHSIFSKPKEENQENLLDIIQEGDILQKEANQTNFTLIKTNQKEYYFELIKN